MGRPLLAGCATSTRFARAVVRGPVIGSLNASVDEVGVHVDDVSQLLIGTDMGNIIRDSIRAADNLTRALKKQGVHDFGQI